MHVGIEHSISFGPLPFGETGPEQLLQRRDLLWPRKGPRREIFIGGRTHARPSAIQTYVGMERVTPLRRACVAFFPGTRDLLEWEAERATPPPRLLHRRDTVAVKDETAFVSILSPLFRRFLPCSSRSPDRSSVTSCACLLRKHGAQFSLVEASPFFQTEFVACHLPSVPAFDGSSNIGHSIRHVGFCDVTCPRSLSGTTGDVIRCLSRY
jgi:hypothetical protein